MSRLITTSDLHLGKSTLFKSFLLAGVLAISAVFIWYTFNVIDKLQSDTRDQVQRYVMLWQLAANSPTSSSEMQFIFEEIIVKATFPILVMNDEMEPIAWRNVSGIDPEDNSPETIARLKQVAKEMRSEYPPQALQIGDELVNWLYYGDTEVIGQLKMMPFIEIGIVLAFMAIGLIGFQNIRRSEERHIWVGMAKETAHQLGTPISSLMGWLEVLGADHDEESGAQPLTAAELSETVDDMRVDVDRLQKVAKRFGQIGSIPELQSVALKPVLEEIVDYYRRRLPFEGRGIQILLEVGEIPMVDLNAELFGWALENMIKNSLQAVDSINGRVRITCSLESDRKRISLCIVDNGSGIPIAIARKIFRAGVTSKKRGWGLGLTLVKRIIEEYHGGQIRLEKSKPGETQFRINLPATKRT